MNKKSSGFTLIELLVVVLIVAILAAIALPQYQRAVVRSQFTEAMTNLKAMQDALNRCLLAQGTTEMDTFCSDMNNWDITPPGTLLTSSSSRTSSFIYNVMDTGTVAALYVPFQASVCIINNRIVGGPSYPEDCAGTGTLPSYDLWKMIGIDSDEECASC